jgi:hypothetical protein
VKIGLGTDKCASKLGEKYVYLCQMIKNGLLILAVSFALNLAQAQVINVEGGNKHTYYLNATAPVDCHMPFTNITGKSTVFAYSKVSSDFPFAWAASLCDNRNCHPDLKQEDSFAVVGKDAVTEFKVTVDPQGVADTSTVVYAVYDNSNPSKKDTIQFTFILQWGAGLMESGKMNAHLFPNPATNILNIVELNTDAVVSIYASDSRLIKQEIVGALNPQIDIKTLQSGFYFVSYNQGNQLLRGSFVKQ